MGCKYTPPQIDTMLDGLKITVDTREQDTKLSRKRLKQFKQHERKCLKFGDYSASYIDVDGTVKSLECVAIVERKMSLGELCMCFTKDRKRFQREFEKAKQHNCRIHLIIENDNYENLFNENYRSKFSAKSLIASLLSWSIRYNIHIHFCKSETTGKLISEIMHYELREYLISQTEISKDVNE
mgnify:CR=1 FL=1